ncbi:hypothetical protein [Mycolicibacterium sp. F2034L]|uniref:hypothetical protein n=1 Tax=Mycolicibacterium sp. F2034L TaxID=2926422 RepID=UPI001FF337F0|nr:hypothetical protein [Mycolicibacterium sp. F2034L]MCK0174814.1 hypothetical protein [Mycolicibacterium sp. F2034L]
MSRLNRATRKNELFTERDAAPVVANELSLQTPGAVESEIQVQLPPATSEYVNGLPFSFDADGYPTIGGTPTAGPPLEFLPGGLWNSLAGKPPAIAAADVDGTYAKNSTWWAGEIKTGVALSTDQAFVGSQSLKITGNRVHYPYVVSAGLAGNLAAFPVVAGNLLRMSFRVWRPAANSDDGLVKAVLHLVGAAGTDTVDFDLELEQADIPVGDTGEQAEWVEYLAFAAVPYTGSHAPYQAAYTSIVTTGAASTDVLHIDDVKHNDVTGLGAVLNAPPPTGIRAIDTAVLKRLVDRAQAAQGVVLLQDGTYAADIVTKRLTQQPSIIGKGLQRTMIDGTLKLLGTIGPGKRFSGGWLSDFSFVGNHPTKVALEFNGTIGYRWERLAVEGTFERVILFHNELPGSFTEMNSGQIDLGFSTGTVLEYRVSGDQPSFHGSGITAGSTINQRVPTTAPLILISANARPYNAPLSATIWTRSSDQPIIKNLGQAGSNFYGNLQIEAFDEGDGGAVVCQGLLYYAGTVSAFGSGSFASNAAAVSLGDLSLSNWVNSKGGATPRQGVVTEFLYDKLGQVVAWVRGVASATSYLVFANASDAQPQISATGPAGAVNLLLRPQDTGKVGIRDGADFNKRVFFDTADLTTGISHQVRFTDGSGAMMLRVSPPASATAPGKLGQFAVDTGHFYVCIGTDTWRRVAISSW